MNSLRYFLFVAVIASIIGGLLSFSPVSAATAAAGPSFNCARARLPSEMAICGSPALATIDRQIDDLFKRLLASVDGGARDGVTAEQQQWKAQRNICAANEACLASAMGLRLAALTQAALAPQPVAAPEAPASGFEMLNDFDLPFADYRSGMEDASLRKVTLATCQAQCTAEDRCRSFTYNVKQRVCFLKEGVPESKAFRGAISGIKLAALPAPEMQPDTGPAVGAVAEVAEDVPAATSPSAPATMAVAAAPAAPAVAGQWSGSFTCNTAKPGRIDLTIDSAADGSLSGTVRFTPPDGGASAAYALQGIYADNDRSFQIMPSKWIDRPAGASPMGITGKLRDNGRTIDGSLTGCGGDASLLADRIEVPAGTVAAGTVAANNATAVAAAPASIGGPLEGTWQTTLTCVQNEKVLYTLSIYQGASALQAVATVKAGPRLVLVGGSMLLSAKANGRVLDFAEDRRLSRFVSGRAARGGLGVLSGELSPDGKRITGVFTDSAARANGCTAPVSLSRIGPAPSADPAQLQALVGRWAGFDTGFRDLNGDPPVSFPLADRSRSPLQTSAVTMEITRQGNQVVAHYMATQPISESAQRRDRLDVVLRPLPIPLGDKVLFAATEVRAREGTFQPNGQPDNGPLLAFSRRGDSLVFASEVQRARLNPVAVSADLAQIGREDPPLVLDPVFAGGSLAQKPTLTAQCSAIQDWMKPFDGKDLGAMTQDEVIDLGLPMFADASFKPLFGRSYGLTTEPDRLELWVLLQRLCSPRLGDKNLDYLAGTVFPVQLAFQEIVTKLANRDDSAGWAKGALAEMNKLATDPGSRPRLAALDAEADKRADELAPGDQTAFADALTAKRQAIDVVEIEQRIAAVPRLPDDPSSLGRLKKLLDDAGDVGVPNTDIDKLRDVMAAKASGITGPALAAALQATANLPPTLASLSTATEQVRQLDAMLNDMIPETGSRDFATAMQPIVERRHALLNDPAVQQAFPGIFEHLRSEAHAADTVRNAARQYLYDNEMEQGGYAQAIAIAIPQVEIASIDLEDQSGTAGPGEPSAMQMLLAVKASYDRENAMVNSMFGGCERDEHGLATGPLDLSCMMEDFAQGKDVGKHITSFTKLGCAPSPGSEYECEFAVAVQSEALSSVPILAPFMGVQDRYRGLFAPASNGWSYSEE